jgi:hypothetical protein
MKRALICLGLSAVLALALAPQAIAATIPAAPRKPPTTIRTITDLMLSSGQHGKVYNRVRFRSSGSHQRATLTITSAHHITFRNCVFDGSAWNGISINDRNGSVHDIRFVNCYVRASARMGFECTARGHESGYYRVDLCGVTFAPQGSQAISYDGLGSRCLIANVLIKGAGTNPAYPWGQGLELNGPTRMTIDGLRICQTRGSAFNLTGTGLDSQWTFNRVRADMTVRYQKVKQGSLAQVICAGDMVGSKWTNTIIRSAAPGGGVAYLDNCHNNDFQGVSWHDTRGGIWKRPMITAACSNNRF